MLSLQNSIEVFWVPVTEEELYKINMGYLRLEMVSQYCEGLSLKAAKLKKEKLDTLYSKRFKIIRVQIEIKKSYEEEENNG